MKFGWISDTHLDTIQYGMERRRSDFMYAFNWAIDDMLANQILVIIHSGDLINSNRPSPATMKLMQVVNKKLRRANAVMYVVSGNHDRTTPHWVETLENADYDFGIQLLDFKRVVHQHPDNPDGVSFYGVPGMSPQQFKEHKFEPATVLIMHQMLKEFIDYEHVEYCLSVADIPKLYRLAAVGDVHVHKLVEWPERPGCFLGYPGSTELKSETEQPDKYWVECVVDVQGLMTLLPHRINTRPILKVDIIAPNTDDLGIDNVIVQVRQWEESNGKGKENYRPPIIFIRYLQSLTNVMPKFKTAFDPDQYVLRFKPVFGPVMRKTPNGLVEDPDDLTIEDILRGELSTHQDLFDIASKLINPDIDANSALDEFIDGRLRKIEAATAIADV